MSGLLEVKMSSARLFEAVAISGYMVQPTVKNERELDLGINSRRPRCGAPDTAPVIGLTLNMGRPMIETSPDIMSYWTSFPMSDLQPSAMPYWLSGKDVVPSLARYPASSSTLMGCPTVTRIALVGLRPYLRFSGRGYEKTRTSVV